jgi:hypothetical protein
MPHKSAIKKCLSKYWPSISSPPGLDSTRSREQAAKREILELETRVLYFELQETIISEELHE